MRSAPQSLATIALAHDDGGVEIFDLVHITSIKSIGNGTAP